MTKYFPDARCSEASRPLLAFSSYNAGPGNTAKTRAEADSARQQVAPAKG